MYITTICGPVLAWNLSVISTELCIYYKCNKIGCGFFFLALGKVPWPSPLIIVDFGWEPKKLRGRTAYADKNISLRTPTSSHHKPPTPTKFRSSIRQLTFQNIVREYIAQNIPSICCTYGRESERERGKETAALAWLYVRSSSNCEVRPHSETHSISLSARRWCWLIKNSANYTKKTILI